MRFPVGFAVFQKFGDTQQPVVFFETPDSDLMALRGPDRFVESDFESIMPLILKGGTCEFQIPASMTRRNEGAQKTAAGVLKLLLSMARDASTGRDVYAVSGSIEAQGKLFFDGFTVDSPDLRMCIEKFLSEIYRVSDVVPNLCFFCKFSDYENGTSIGNLRCYVSEKEAYCKAAATESYSRYEIFSLAGNTVDDFDTSAGFEVRPVPWGYRGFGLPRDW